MSSHRLTRFGITESGCRLEINEEGWLNAGRCSSKEHTSNVVSLLGRTHTGKSFVCAEILKRVHRFGQDDSPAVAPEDTEDMHPTSSDIVSYEAAFVPSDVHFRLLDCEGEGGTIAPKDLIDSTQWTEEVVRKERSKAVEDNLSRLAYVCSEVVIFISRGDLADNAFLEDVIGFAFRQTDNVHATRPGLIIVANMQRSAQKTIEETTEKFFATHDPERELFHYYSDIKVTNLPDSDGRGRRTFDTRMDELISTIESMMEAKTSERKRLGLHYSERIWLQLLHVLVTEHFENPTKNSPVRMGEIIRMALLPKEYVRKAMGFFSAALQYMAITLRMSVHEAFFDARKLAVQMLAAIEAANFLEWETSRLGDLVSSPVQKAETKQKALVDFQMLVDCLKREAPCSAVLQRKGAEIPCLQLEVEHGDYHCNDLVPAHVKDIDPEASLWGKAVKKIKKKFNKLANRNFPSKWGGEYLFEDCFKPEELQEVFTDAFSKLLKASRAEGAAARVELVRRAFPMREGLSAPQVEDHSLMRCIVCLGTSLDRSSEIDLKQLFPCGHKFCEVCLDPFRQALNTVSPLSGDRVLASICPLCQTIIKGTT